jgi:hypothetical protein
MNPSIIRNSELSTRMGISPSTLWRLAQRSPELRACIIDEQGSRAWWSVSRLIAAGFLINDAPATAPTAPTEHVNEVAAHAH